MAKEIRTDIATYEPISSVKDTRAIIVRRAINIASLREEEEIIPPLIGVFGASRISRIYDEVDAPVSRTAHSVFERIRTCSQVEFDAHVVDHNQWKVATSRVATFPSASTSST